MPYLAVARVIHDVIANLKDSARIVAAAHLFRQLSNSFLHFFNVRDIIQVDDTVQMMLHMQTPRSGVSLEENIMSSPVAPIALESISSVMEEQSQPQPYSLQNLDQKRVWRCLDCKIFFISLVPCKGFF